MAEIFSDIINNNYLERRNDLGNFKALLEQGLDEKYIHTIIKTGIVILYSHFQGLVEFIIEEFEDFLKRENISIDNLSYNIREGILKHDILYHKIAKALILEKKLPKFGDNYYLFEKNNNGNILISHLNRSSNSIDMFFLNSILEVLDIDRRKIYAEDLITPVNLCLISGNDIGEGHPNIAVYRKKYYEKIFNQILRKNRHIIAHGKSKGLRLSLPIKNKLKIKLLQDGIIRHNTDIEIEKAVFLLVVDVVYDKVLFNFKEEILSIVDKKLYLI